MVTDKDLKDLMLAPPVNHKSIAFTVGRFYTDANCTVIAKGAAPAAMQIKYPIYLLGDYDRQGAYWLGQKNTPSLPGVEFLAHFTWGINNPYFIGFNPLSTIQREIKAGDLVTVYTDNRLAPNYFVFIVVACDTVSAASILANLTQGKNKTEMLELWYYANVTTQWEEPIQRLLIDPTGDVQANYIEPKVYRQPKTVQNGFVKIPWKMVLNQYKGLNTYFQYATDTISFSFKLNIQKDEHNR